MKAAVLLLLLALVVLAEPVSHGLTACRAEGPAQCPEFLK